ncbi:hypothetical protein TIFTF001_014090 [Ficus carica]|uniref:Calmodulin-binding heat-shock protein n=1 Tax=Ficus carica TaxID=3494 RepID=A0AA88A352_FICCA|nr:hypothetical protein TIFTF001_014090 [Ficus carica]
MSIACGVPILECVYCLGCARWLWLKCLYTAGYESENWGQATTEEFEPVPRLCRLILAVYEDDLRNPLWAPPGGYGIDPDYVILRKDYEETQGRVPPYMVYLDHDNADIVLAIRGLNLARECDYAVLLDNKLGQTKFDGGYVHNGLLKAAECVFDAEWEGLRELVERNPTYTLTFTGHSLGAGVVALLTMVAIHNREKLGTIERKRIRCYAIAPARCVSLNLAVRYADVINSVVLQDELSNLGNGHNGKKLTLVFFKQETARWLDLSEEFSCCLPIVANTFLLMDQDDFLPRTTTALEDVFRSLICLPCLLCLTCLKETCTLEEKRLKDPRRLYAPGRLYHIVERKPFRIGRFPPVVRTAVPVDGRFEHIVLSCNATSDHTILWIERESQRALDLMLERDQIMEIPPTQRMERQESLVREHSEEYRAALQRAIALNIPHATLSSPYGTFNELEGGENSGRSGEENSGRSGEETSLLSFKKWRESWDNFIERQFDVDESGRMVFKRT